MAQTLNYKIRKLSQQYNIQAVVETAKQIQKDLEDEMLWNSLTTAQKTKWFKEQCAKYNLTTKQIRNQIKVNELPEIGDHGGSRAYFTVFLPRNEVIGSDELSPWKLEIGGAYVKDKNGGIWMTARGLKGKEKQIKEVIRLNRKGE